MLAKILDLCAERRITVSKLERETRISNGTIRKWGASSPTVTNLKRVADYFGVTVDELLKE